MTECFVTLSCCCCRKSFMNGTCVHSFCNDCFQSENESSNYCNLCRNPPAEGSHNKRSRIQEIHEYPRTSGGQILNECSECKESFFPEVLFCEVCFYSFCSPCIDKHKNTINKMYSAAETFATEDKLQQVQDMRRENEDKLVKIESIISRLTEKKSIFRNKVIEMDSILKQKRNHLLDVIEKMCKKQREELYDKENHVIQEYDEELARLRKTQAVLKEVVQASRHFPIKPSDANIVKFHNCSKQVSKIEDMNYMFEFKKVGVNQKTLDIQKGLKYLIVQIELFINKDIFIDNEAYVISDIYESEALMGEMCYDAENKHLYVLERRVNNYKILQISGNIVLNESFQITVDCVCSPRIALLPNRCILILLNKKLSLIESNLCGWGTLPPMLKDLTVSAICTNPCVTQTFMFVYGTTFSLIYKYNSKSDPLPQRLPITKEPNYMAVHDDLDHIVFGGLSFKNLSLYSLKKSQYVGIIWKAFALDRFGGFLADNLFLVYNSHRRTVEMIEFENKQNILYIENVHNKGKKEITNIKAIAPCNSNCLFMCQSDEGTGKIYKVMF